MLMYKALLSISFACCAITLSSVGVAGVEVTIYDNYNKKGEEIYMNIQNCTNMPQEWHDRASSINIYDSICIKFFEHADCKGRYVTFRSAVHTDYQDNLKDLGFNDVISSLSPCSLQIEAGRYVIQNLGDNKMLTVVEDSALYSRAYSKYWANLKSQHWDVGQVAGSEIIYDLTPVDYPSEKPIIYDVSDFQRLGKIREKPAFLIESVDDWKYVIKDAKTKKCLATGKKDDIVPVPCLYRSPNQQWLFRLTK